VWDGWREGKGGGGGVKGRGRRREGAGLISGWLIYLYTGTIPQT